MELWKIVVFLAVPLVELTALWFAYRSLQVARTPQAAMGWVIFFLTLPFLAVPLWVVLGQSRFPQKVTTRRELRGVVRRIRDEKRRFSPTSGSDPTVDHLRVRAFETLAGVPLLGGNQADLLIDGEETFDAIFEAIAQAQSYVLLAFYTIRDDATGRRLLDRISERARAGVRVCVLYDGMGSNKLTRAYLEDARAAGVAFVEFNANRRLRSRFQLNFRNHRKIVVIDGDVAFTGGLNIGNEYMGRNAHLGHWRDTFVRVRGPVVAEIQLSFAEDWLWATDETLALNWDPAPCAGSMDALVVAPGPADPIETGSFYFCNAIGAARERLWIATPYFVPDVDVLTALKLAALRGVDVRILIPEEADHLLTWLAAYSFFDEVREVGVKIHHYTEGFMHQKVVLIDDDIASVGSINLDNRSCRLNFEITLIGLGNDFAGRVAAMLEEDMATSPVFRTPLRNNPRMDIRYGAHFARLFAPIL